MKIIIAPAKIMKIKQTNLNSTNILFKDKTNYLKDYLSKYSIDELHDLMKISFKMADTVYNYYHQDNDLTPAIFCYQGTVFKQLSLNTYNQNDFDYLDNYLNILSAYYGILKYNTNISPYRLDMTMKLDINLYDYWQEEINNYFKEEDYLINLASKEFITMINHPHIINIDFVEKKADKLTRNSMRVKTARGKMLEMMVKNKITNLATLKQISFDDYHYNESLSTNNNLVFIRDYPKTFHKL